MNRERKVGIDLLRIAMCIVVVFLHFSPRHEIQSFSIFSEFQKLYELAVPIFFLISFFFISGKLDYTRSEGNRRLLFSRLNRLCIPQLFWTVVLFFGFKLLHILGMYGTHLTYKQFLAQLVLGHSFNSPMWFIVDTIVFTCVFLLLFNAFRKHFLSVSIIAIVVSFALQYSGLNYSLFGGLPYEYRYPLGRLVEMCPYAFGGYICHKLYSEGKIKYGKLLAIPLVVLIHYNYAFPWLDAGPSFGYAGVRYFIEAVMTLFVFLDIEPILSKSNVLKKITGSLAPITFGVYIIHYFVGLIVLYIRNQYFANLNDICVCLATVIIAFLICFGIVKIPSKRIQQMVR
ncbi:MAG: acyltransferase [Bacteroidales bacterium]|nr:acyltransferase [Bacteroidales bacterium]